METMFPFVHFIWFALGWCCVSAYEQANNWKRQPGVDAVTPRRTPRSLNGMTAMDAKHEDLENINRALMATGRGRAASIFSKAHTKAILSTLASSEWTLFVSWEHTCSCMQLNSYHMRKMARSIAAAAAPVSQRDGRSVTSQTYAWPQSIQCQTNYTLHVDPGF